MSAPNFEPKDGVQAQWRYAYDLVLSKEPGEDVTFLELAELLGLDHLSRADKQIMRGIMDIARKHLEDDRLQTVETVYKYGWRVTTPSKNLDLIEDRRQKSARAVERTARLLNATERAALSPIDQQRYDAEQRSVLGAARIFGRKRKNFSELERQAPRQLPLRGGGQ